LFSNLGLAKLATGSMPSTGDRPRPCQSSSTGGKCLAKEVDGEGVLTSRKALPFANTTGGSSSNEKDKTIGRDYTMIKPVQNKWPAEVANNKARKMRSPIVSHRPKGVLQQAEESLAMR
jgi:hypothetical protein